MTAVGEEPCPVCGSVMLERVPQDATGYWGCSRFPECSGTRPMAPAEERAARAADGRIALSARGRPRGWRDSLDTALSRPAGRDRLVLRRFVAGVVLIGLAVVLALILIVPVLGRIAR